ncbi:unnamed protein product [Arabidopsis thaliana]|uniref:(thale cress) hypothetical protein n=1 Tax=Arabidopsis thaliana TaxID=3702 RepID=A0A7G2DZY6_ARATH|nr:unnamed protein product [Arabidopsis thaliana]
MVEDNPILCNRASRRISANLRPLHPLDSAQSSTLTQDEPSKSSASVHWTSVTERTPLLHALLLDPLWLRCEISESCFLLGSHGSTKRLTVSGETLISKVFSLYGLDPFCKLDNDLTIISPRPNEFLGPTYTPHWPSYHGKGLRKCVGWFPYEVYSLNQTYIDYKLSPEGSTFRISLMAGLYLGSLLASCSESLSRIHDITSFWIIRTSIKQPQVRLVQSLTWPPTVSKPFECVWQVLDPCFKALQQILLDFEGLRFAINPFMKILLMQPSFSMERKTCFNSSFLERTVSSCPLFLTILLTCVEDVMRLEPARPTVMDSLLTSRCLVLS